MIHKEITDSQWNTIVKHLPKPAKTGRPRCNDRITINGILFVLSVGCRWEEIPAQYGSKSTAHLRFTELESDMKRNVIIIWDLYIWHQL